MRGEKLGSERRGKENAGRCLLRETSPNGLRCAAAASRRLLRGLITFTYKATAIAKSTKMSAATNSEASQPGIALASRDCWAAVVELTATGELAVTFCGTPDTELK